MSRRVLVTGARGFVGRHAASALKARGWAVLGSDRSRADLADPEAAARLLEKTKPDAVLHAAGRTKGADAGAFWDANVTPTINVLEAALRLSKPPRVVVVGSASEYGDAAKGRPAREDGPCRPLTPYGASKLSQTLAALSYRHRGLDVVVARLFNISGPDCPDHIVPGTFACQLVQGGPALVTGDLSPSRDFVDIRDMARALALLCERRAPAGVYNVCSGKPVKIRDVVASLIRLSRRSVERRLDRSRGGVPLKVLIGDPRKLRAATGWTPKISLEQSLRDTLASLSQG